MKRGYKVCALHCCECLARCLGRREQELETLRSFCNELLRKKSRRVAFRSPDPVAGVHRYPRAEDVCDGEVPSAQHPPLVGALGAGAPGDQPSPAERRRDDALPPGAADNRPDPGPAEGAQAAGAA